MNKRKKKVLMALSGGVDSSVTAALLKKQGYDIVGVFLLFTRIKTNKNNTNTNQHESENICCDQESLRTARAVCDKLDIPFYVLDVSKEFKQEVVDYFIAEYEAGRTPNPCVVCNKKIKFGWLLKKAKCYGFDYLATGHYARLWREFPISNFQFPNKSKIQNSKSQNNYQLSFPTESGTIRIGNLDSVSEFHSIRNDNIQLLEAKDKKKDQSYFLWQLDQKQLAKIIFPLGEYTKIEVKKLAKKYKLSISARKESQDICFLPSADLADFLRTYADKLTKPGNIVDKAGKIIGRHKGLCNYTIGQRKNLGGDLRFNLPAGKAGISDLRFNKHRIKKVYVIKLNIKKNELVVGLKKDLYSSKLEANNTHWINPTCIKKQFQAWAKIRSTAKKERCTVIVGNRKILVRFQRPQRAITPGQSVVIYDGKEVLGGGIIK